MHGHSMGGATACVAAANSGLPVAVLTDRSFSTLKRVIRAHTSKGPLGVLLGAVFASLAANLAVILLESGFGIQTHTSALTLGPATLGVAAQVYWVLPFLQLPLEKLPPLLRTVFTPAVSAISFLMALYVLGRWQTSLLGRAVTYGTLAQCVAAAAAAGGVLPGVLATLGTGLGWEIDAESAWPRITGQKGIIYHKRDTMIDYTSSSIHSAVQDGPACPSVELTGYHGPACHMYGLMDGYPIEWNACVNLARTLLHRAPSKM
eukprot:TRINITY_DN21742_c0_g1_i1.p1 TRINITY_DN21742_c0_g1~~TRINITY_DN21742_c0_g1_i1.p1  ORF type:complete len:262 (+),score=44.06 TRINITY_DN21742_c0_g1_i1:231-1016(+)